MRTLLLCLLLSLSTPQAISQSSTTALTANEIMARVAANQDRTDAERAHFVYVQHARVQSRKGKTVMCEEITDSRVTPSATHSQQTLLTLAGRVRIGSSYVPYSAMPIEAKGHDDTVEVHDSSQEGAIVLTKDTDVDLVEHMRKNFTDDSRSRDGVSAGLFPLTSHQQQNMVFTLRGREARNGHDTFHITFKPKDESDYDWRGDVWIDAAVFQPVMIRTALSKNIPLAVRMLLGTSLPGIGFTVIYAPQEDGVWFPVSFGTEFKLNVLFFFHREIVVAVNNRQFEKTHVSTTIHGVAQPN